MLDGLNSSTWPVLGALAVSVVCVAVAIRESRLRRRVEWSYLWPLFWWATAAMLLTMAIGQAGDVGQFLADLGRSDAVANDWYENRRSAQTVVVAGLALAWALTSAIAIWRVPERRRRYLPMALVVLSLVCYGSIRVISLHQIDAIVYRRHLFGAEIGRLLEIAGLGAAFAISLHGLVSQPRRLDSFEDADRSPVPGSDSTTSTKV